MTPLLRVLIVEDNPSDADLMLLRLRKEGLECEWVRVEDQDAYLQALEEGYDLILSDWTLPDFSGFRALELMSERNLDIPFVIVSGCIGEEAAVRALKMGASDYILKDRPQRLGQAVRNALEQKALRDERREAERMLLMQSAALNAAANAIVIADSDARIEWVNAAYIQLTGYSAEESVGKRPTELAWERTLRTGDYQMAWETLQTGKVWRGEMVNQRKDGQTYYEEHTITPVFDPTDGKTKYIAIIQDVTERKEAEISLNQASRELEMAYDATLQGWSNALELREHETAGHSRRVVDTTIRLSQALGVPADLMVHIQRGALLHDIGKMGIPDNILLKAGPLTQEEWVEMRKHPIYAYDLLAQIPYLVPALVIPLYHHERWDGSGYPKGLQGKAIPLAARIFAVVDVWDALSHDRPYRSAWPEEKVFAYLREQAGKQFDPHVVEVFLELLGRR